MCFFETPQTALVNQAPARAALDLANAIEKAAVGVLKTVPLHSLVDESEHPVRIPARLFLLEDLDYEPLRFEATQLSGELPRWVRLNADTGHLSAAEPVPVITEPLQLRVDFAHAEGVVGAAPCGITPDRLGGPTAPWSELTIPIVQRFSDLNLCQLDKGTREGLHEHFAEVYDFKQQSVRERTVGEWVSIMSRVLRMLRSATVANLAHASAHRMLANKAVVQPRTP